MMNEDWRTFGLNLISASLVTLGLLLAGQQKGGKRFLSAVLRQISRPARSKNSSDSDSEWPTSTGKRNRKK